jgi:hypothetical protein
MSDTSGQTTQQQSSGTVNSQQQSSDWRASLPDDIKNEASLQSFPDVASVAKSYVHLNKKLGSPKVDIPSKDASDDDWKEVMYKLGTPRDAKLYDIQVPKEAPVDEKFINNFKKQAWEAGVHPRHAQKMLDWYLKESSDILTEHQKVQETQRESQMMQLKNELGEKYNSTVERAQVAVKELAGKDWEKFSQFLDQSGLGDHPQVIKMFSKVADLMGEDKLKGKASYTLGKSPDELMNEIADLKKHGSPYWDKKHSDHSSYVERVSHLYSRLYS